MDPVQGQLEAYNRRDIDGFLACYGEDAVVRHGDGRVLMTGHDQLRSRYERLFETYPHLKAVVPRRVRVGDWTVDEERVHLAEGDDLHVLVAYGVRHGLIRSVVMLRSDV